MLRLTCIAFLVTCTIGLHLEFELNTKWQNFKSLYGKKYNGSDEEKRKLIFKKNVEAILQHNLMSSIEEFSYILGINEFSDMEHQEFLKVMAGVPIPSNYTSGNEVMVPSDNLKAPATLDWRDSRAVTSVKNQASCGACYAFSAVATVEGIWAIRNDELLELSPQNLVDCTTNNKYGNVGCVSGSPSQAMKYIIDNGVNLNSCYKYEEKQNKCAFKTNCKAVKISRVVDVPRGNEQALLEAVANSGPISVGINAENEDLQNYRSGVYSPLSCSQSPTHSVTLIGYGSQNGNDYWLLKNSWGTSWGEGGFFKLARNKGNMCGVARMAVYAVL